MVCSENVPRGASTEPKRIGLLVDRDESRADEGVPKLSDFARLADLHSHKPTRSVPLFHSHHSTRLNSRACRRVGRSRACNPNWAIHLDAYKPARLASARQTLSIPATCRPLSMQDARSPARRPGVIAGDKRGEQLARPSRPRVKPFQVGGRYGLAPRRVGVGGARA